MFDNICKFLAENYSPDFTAWLLGEPIFLTQLSPSELSLEPIRADALILLESEQIVLHLEFQTEPDPDIPFRMLDYRTRVYRRFPHKQMRQVVIYLKASGSEFVRQNTFNIENTRHQFEVIRLWEVPKAQLLPFSGLLPFVVLSQTENREETLREVAQEIDKIKNRRQKNNVTAATSILAGLVLEKAFIHRLLREEIMRESVIYQEIVSKAEAEGEAKGEAKGIIKGRIEGKIEGRQEGEAVLILRLLNRRFGEIPANLVETIRALPVERLELLGEALLDFTTEADLVNWLSETN